MSIRLLQGDCRDTLATLEPKSIQCLITSPPYYGLRDYGLPPSLWADGVSCCLGLEPTPDLWIEHLVEVFRQVRRVLRDDGTVWLNLGDSYAGSGKGPTGHNGIGNQKQRQGFSGARNSPRKLSKTGTANGKSEASAAVRMLGIPGFKAKDLMMLPARVAMALQADGWYLRSMIPWLKRNSMPESVTDRPATAVEYVFLLSKGPKYFWDADAVRVASQQSSIERMAKPWNGNTDRSYPGGVQNHLNTYIGSERGQQKAAAGRSRRNSDWFFESWQGLELDDDGEPLALIVNPSPYKGAHYATFPPKLVEPMIKAGTSEKGQCPECGAPWVRVVERQKHPTRDMESQRALAEARNGRGDGHVPGPNGMVDNTTTTGWRPTCLHTDAEPVPQMILDCFGGSGTVGMVADRLGRNVVLCELKDDYGLQAQSRVVGDAPMFVEFTTE